MRLGPALMGSAGVGALGWALDAGYAFDFPANAARFTDRPAGNLLTFPEAFDNASWTKAQSSISADAISAPDGTATADKLIEDTSAAVHDLSQSIAKAASATTYAMSVYAKAGERTEVRVGIDAGSSSNQAFAIFNLSSGTISVAASVAGSFTSASATIEALANGWYRCVVVATTGTETTVRPRIMLYNGVSISYTGDGTSGIYVWGARLEAGSVAANYLAREARYYALASVPGWTFSRASTGYALNNAGQLVSFASGAPRITDRGFLAEGSRQNLCLQSQTFDNASWTKTDSTVTADNTTAPDGTLTADLITEGSAGTAQIGQGVTVSSGATVAISVFLKRGNTDWVRIQCVNASNFFRAWFNLGTGAVGTSGVGGTGVFTSASVEAYANGFYRVVLVGSIPATTAYSIFFNTAAADNSATRVSGGTYCAWGAQLEAASFPSSYIPTTTASVTRAADSLIITGVTGLASPLSVFAELEPSALPGDQRYFQIDDGAVGNNRFLAFISSSTVTRFQVRTATVDQANVDVSGALVIGSIYRTAARADTNDVRGARGGALSTSDTSATMPSGMTTFRFTQVGSEPWVYIRRAAIFTRALTNAELQAITL